MRHLLLCLSLSLGCAARKAPQPDSEQTPAWATPSGKDQARLDVVHLLLDGGNPEGALAMIARLRAEGFEDPQLDLLQGQALVRTGLAADARARLVTVPRRHPAYGPAQNELGMLELELRDLDRAIGHFQAATGSTPNNASYWNNLGFALLTRGRASEAVVALRQSIALDGSSARTRNNLGYALLADGQDEEAWRLFRTTGSEADARYNLGVGLELRGDMPAAADAYNAALTAAPQHAQARAALIRVLPIESGAPSAPIAPTSPLESP